MGQEEVTILMATYNGESYLKEQLDSIQQQDCKNWKLIVGDDGSRDGTLDILYQFQQECPNSVEVIKNDPPTGAAKNNFMQLLAKADTSYIMFCDQDDIWEPHKIQNSLAYMKRMEIDTDMPVLIHSDLAVLGEEGIISESFFKYQNLPANMELNNLLIQNYVTGCTVMINRNLQEKMLQVKDYNQIIMHDYWAALIATVYGLVGFIPSHTMYYRQHSNNSVGAKASRNPLYLIRRLIEGRKKYKKQMKESIMQVSYFLQSYEKDYPIKEETQILLEGYASLSNRNKLYRMWFYSKNKVYKQGFIRVLMQYIWG